ncbi:MAG: hypothetical protein Q8Q48_01785 [Candidatus Staskawiczbacteria bacterium]|nr:hypothetical protein [Candidatus Staskawiczbacteria bacterium]
MKKHLIPFSIIFLAIVVFFPLLVLASEYNELHCPKIIQVEDSLGNVGTNNIRGSFIKGVVNTITFKIIAVDPKQLALHYQFLFDDITGDSMDNIDWTTSNTATINTTNAYLGPRHVTIRVDNQDDYGCIGAYYDTQAYLQYEVYPPETSCLSFTYSDWSVCQSNGTKTRSVISSSPSGCTGGNPVLTQSCNFIPICSKSDWNSTLSPTICPSSSQQTKIWNKTGQCQGGVSRPSQETVSCNYQVPACTNFTYGDWGECSLSGLQSRELLSSWPNNCTGGNPITNQSCEKPEIKNVDTISNNNQNTEAKNSGKVLGDVDIKNTVVTEEKSLITKIDNGLSRRVSGNILLQVEKNGEGWYVYPDNKKKYYLGHPADAFSIMRNLGLGIAHSELAGYLVAKFPSRLSGKILLDVEQNGEAYYINPNDLKGYYLNRPADAFRIMRELGLGITNDDIRKIDVGETE